MALKLTIPTMACSSCVDNITNAVKSIDAQALLTADLANKHVAIDSSQSAAAIIQAITQAGYPVTSA